MAILVKFRAILIQESRGDFMAAGQLQNLNNQVVSGLTGFCYGLEQVD